MINVLGNTVYDYDNFPFECILNNSTIVGNRIKYFNIPVAFDIECTSYNRYKKDNPDLENDIHFAFMYHWQMCIGDEVVFGRRWEELIDLLKRIQEFCRLNDTFICIYVHNLGYEFQFLRRFICPNEMFARKERNPLYFRIPYIEFRCSYFLTNMSLDALCENTPGIKYHKKTGKYDYDKLRTADTEMTQEELEYCYCDVAGLCEILYKKFAEFDVAHIPLTSTGYVRRECRERMQANRKNKSLVNRIQLTYNQYLCARKAFRGGDTSGNACNSGKILDDLQSYDMVSSYPAVIVSEKFPMSKFVELKEISRKEFKKYIDKFACLMTITIKNVSVKNRFIVPYLDVGHCIHSSNIKSFNGRILSADEITISCTDVDFKLIENEYNFDQLMVNEFYYAKYGYLPDELRQYVIDMFRGKCELKIKCKSEFATDDDELLYAKYKNRINAIFGMMVTDIIAPEILYDGEWSVDDAVCGEQKLNDYYNNYNTFLTYQWGVWVTAHARKRLRVGIYAVGRDGTYNDTDSVKCRGNHIETFRKLSEINIQKLINCGLDAIPEINGTKFYLGEWELEKKHDGIKRFVTVGAKKYCTEYNDGTLEITVAGCSKKLGSEYLKSIGGIEKFRAHKLGTKNGKKIKNEDGLVIPAESSGRTVSWFDDGQMRYITVDGCRMLTGASICIDKTTYVLGVTGEYREHIWLMTGNDYYNVDNYFQQ